MGRKKVLSGNGSNKDKKKSDVLSDIRQLLEWSLNWMVAIYLFLMIVILPVYFTDGYANIGSDKYAFFYQSTCSVGIWFAPCWLIYFILGVIRSRRDNPHGWIKTEWKMLYKKITVTDWFVLGYGVVTVLSYLCSDYKEEVGFGNALEGVTGWYLGLNTQLLLVGVYFAVSRFWSKNKWIPALWGPVTLFVFILGYLNRFGVRPFEMKNTTVEFLSVVGNMNWYCGYIVIVFFGGLFYIWTATEKKIWLKVLYGIWMTIGFGTLITQGSRSGMVTLAVMFLTLYLFSMKHQEKLQLICHFLLSMVWACMVTYGIRSIWPHKFNYPDGLTDFITYSPLVFVMFGVVVFLLGLVVWFQKREKYPVRYFTICGYASCIILVFVLVGFIILGTINTVYPGKLGSWSELSALTFNWEWGSYRGATWVAGIRCFSEQNLIGKLLGVGPDSMAFYLHSGADPGLLAMINECFQGRLLTNAHCEWLTIMVNNGLLGVFCYAGIFISIIVRCLKNSTQQPIAGACGFAVLAYTVNNVFSFQQVVSAVTIFIVMGMGEAFLRKEAS